MKRALTSLFTVCALMGLASLAHAQTEMPATPGTTAPANRTAPGDTINRLIMAPGQQPEQVETVEPHVIPDRRTMRPDATVEMLPRTRAGALMLYGGWNDLQGPSSLNQYFQSGYHFGLGTMSFFHSSVPLFLRTNIGISQLDFREGNTNTQFQMMNPNYRVQSHNNAIIGQLGVSIGYSPGISKWVHPYVSAGIGALVPVEEGRFYMATPGEEDRVYVKYTRKLGATANGALGLSVKTVDWLHVFGEAAYTYEFTDGSRLRESRQLLDGGRPDAEPTIVNTDKPVNLQLLQLRLGLRLYVNSDGRN